MPPSDEGGVNRVVDGGRETSLNKNLSSKFFIEFTLVKISSFSPSVSGADSSLVRGSQTIYLSMLHQMQCIKRVRSEVRTVTDSRD